MKCCCGNNEFQTCQILRADVIVDENGMFLKNANGSLEGSIYDSEIGSSAGYVYVCTVCEKEYQTLN